MARSSALCYSYGPDDPSGPGLLSGLRPQPERLRIPGSGIAVGAGAIGGAGLAYLVGDPAHGSAAHVDESATEAAAGLLDVLML